MIRMIAVDLDGTLLRTDKTISSATKEALGECRKRGVKVVCATARGETAGQLAPKEMFDGRVLMSGAAAYMGEERVHSRLISADEARGLLAACDQRGLKAASELDGMHYSNFNIAEEWGEDRDCRLTDFRTYDKDSEKIYALVENAADVDFIRRYLPESLRLVVTRDNFAMISSAEATKMKAIAALAARWGIAAGEIAAFGDDLSDIDMLTGCGTGVAMGNAVDEVRAVADEICGTNDGDGVATWLERHILFA